MNTAAVWVIDDDRSIRWVLERALEKAGYQVRSFENAEAGLSALEREHPAVIVSDIRMPGMDGLELLERVNTEHTGVPVIIMTAHSDLESAVSSFHGGAFEYLPKPFDVDEALTLVGRAVEQQRASEDSSVAESSSDAEIIGSSPAMQEVFRAIGRLARSNATVLINGESGTGKELVAGALHRHSLRAEKPFIALNMAAIPRDLMESELFGHERGAFTGAQSRRDGRFLQANGGTLFLDEIGDMPAELQTRLLRVLADGVFYSVGGHTPIQVDVRIIAATHQNLEKLVADGLFREDLFHRLNVIRIHIPALRDRGDDLLLLANHFLSTAAEELGVEPKRLAQAAQQRLLQLPWQGNVRQLENTCRWLTVMAPGREVQVDDLPPELMESAERNGPEVVLNGDWVGQLRSEVQRRLANNESNLLADIEPAFERAMIETALAHTGGRRQDAAHLLGWGRNTLTRKIKDLAID